jgi:hypothetical protein
MQPASPLGTSIVQPKVLQSPFSSNMNTNVDSYVQHISCLNQSGVGGGFTPIDVSKVTPKTPQYTPQQVGAFGGIHEEVLRGVRSSG